MQWNYLPLFPSLFSATDCGMVAVTYPGRCPERRMFIDPQNRRASKDHFFQDFHPTKRLRFGDVRETSQGHFVVSRRSQ